MMNNWLVFTQPELGVSQYFRIINNRDFKNYDYRYCVNSTHDNIPNNLAPV